jgi:hypothetical protein
LALRSVAADETMLAIEAVTIAPKKGELEITRLALAWIARA